jgi:predicted ribosome quality control (RQC) complex YloA/Tae2 family protein
MKFLNHIFLATFLISAMVAAPTCRAQSKSEQAESKPPASPQSDAQKNVQAYIDLLRRDVRQEKAEIMGSVMILSAQDATKFWPIYSEYDAQLAKLNDQRIQNIKEYAQNYNQMTDEKADDLIQKSLAFQKQRAELLAQTYDKVKQALGAVTAARFAQIEHQLLLIIDLQIASSLPIVEQGS